MYSLVLLLLSTPQCDCKKKGLRQVTGRKSLAQCFLLTVCFASSKYKKEQRRSHDFGLPTTFNLSVNKARTHVHFAYCTDRRKVLEKFCRQNLWTEFVDRSSADRIWGQKICRQNMAKRLNKYLCFPAGRSTSTSWTHPRIEQARYIQYQQYDSILPVSLRPCI